MPHTDSPIEAKRKLLDKVVAKLLKKETLDRDDFEKVVGKKVNGEKLKIS